MIVTVTLNPSLDEWIRLPSLRLGALNRAVGFARYPGGKGLNVSRVIHELGGRTAIITLSGGEDGVILRHLLRRLTFPKVFVTVSGSTRNNYKVQTARPRAMTEINTQGPPVSAGILRAVERRLLGLATRASGVALSGSLPPGVPASIYYRWIGLLRRRGVPVVLDTSGAALRQGLRARPWLIKPNRQEASELLGRALNRSRDIIEASRRLVRLGPSLVILSLGADGAVLASANPSEMWMAVPPKVSVDSSVGAGDSLVGGVLVGWMRGLPLKEAFRLGVASGTASVMTPGTQLCRRTDVRRLLPKVKLYRVD
jgi:6-phosphofructokinase 2